MTKPFNSTPESRLSRSDFEGVPAILLVGGLGTRLRSVLSGAPKPLARIGSGSFLELLVRQLSYQGFRRLVMCTGYLASEVEREFGDGSCWDVEIRYSRESHPLGTAGAVKLAGRLLQDASEFLVMNGDSFVEINLQQLLRAHREHGGWITIASRRVENASRYGLLRIDTNSRVVSFEEKSSDQVTGFVNAGVYVFSRTVLDRIADGPASLEREVFPRLLDKGVYSVAQDGLFIDIGTPDDYRRAQELCDHLYSAISAVKSR